MESLECVEKVRTVENGKVSPSLWMKTLNLQHHSVTTAASCHSHRADNE